MGLFWFISATGLTQGHLSLRGEVGSLDRCREYTSPEPGGLPLQLHSTHSVEIRAGGSACQLQLRKCTRRLFTTHLSASQKTIDGLSFSSVKICLSALLIFSSQSDAVPKISIQPNVCQSFRETLQSQNYLHSELNVLFSILLASAMFLQSFRWFTLIISK